MADLSVRLTRLVEADPSLMLGILYVMPEAEWASVVDQSAYRDLNKDLHNIAVGPLRTWRLNPGTHAEDVASEVLLKLGEGRFLKRYEPQRKHPRPYLVKCAWNLARVEARSISRRYCREQVGVIGPE